MRKIIERCPACGGELLVTRMDCRQCDTRVEGKFRATVFDRLSPESLAFAELFVRLKGNTKQMERELDMPYSTVRGKLDDVVQELGPSTDTDREDVDRQEQVSGDAAGGRERAGGGGELRVEVSREGTGSENSDRRKEILDRLERGEIGADEAIDELGGEES